MGKIGMELDFIEMNAIKHALQNVVEQKNHRLDELSIHNGKQSKEELIEMDRLTSDIEKENRLIGKFEVRIEEFRKKNRIPRKANDWCKAAFGR